MELLKNLFFPCLFAFGGCIGFGFLYNVRGPGMLLCATGGAIGWLVYLLSAPLVHSAVVQSFLAAVAVSIWSEAMARIRKCPVTSYQLLALFPLVPGSNVYYTMEYAVLGQTQAFAHELLHTLALAGSLAAGVLMVSSVVRLVTAYRLRRHFRRHHL